MDRTLVIIKPDGIERGLAGEITRRFEDIGLKIESAKTERLVRSKVAKMYAHIKHLPVYEATIDFMCSRPVLLLIFSGKNAAVRAKQLAGATDPSRARRGTIRGDLGIDSKEVADKEGRAVYNLVHVADPENVEREIKLLF